MRTLIDQQQGIVNILMTISSSLHDGMDWSVNLLLIFRVFGFHTHLSASVIAYFLTPNVIVGKR